ncbi:hypothetical protein JCM19992_34900 [Thermostilla marina]
MAANHIAPRRGIDLLQLGVVKKLFTAKWFPYLFQLVLLGLFVAFALYGWNRFPPEGVETKQFAKTNIVNLVIWGMWWPAMVWAAVLFGRVWCAVCPLELVSNGTERLARAVGWPQMVLRRALHSGVLIFLAYAAIQLCIAGAQLHRIPHYTSIFLFILLAAAALTGILWKDRAFCRGFCPVGLLLAVYGRGGMLAVRSKRRDTCDACEGKNCHAVELRTKPDGRSCPSLLNPEKLADSYDCLYCGQCMKACPHDNMGLYLRPLFAAEDRRREIASWPVTLFVMLVSGFVTYELFSEWKAAQAYYLWIPHQVAEALSGLVSEGWIKGVWMLFVVPAVVWTVLGGIVWLLRGAENLLDAWRRLALPMALVVAAGHMSKGLAKFTSWGVYLPMALREPGGKNSALAITAGDLAKPAAMLPMTVVSIAGLVLIAIGCLFAVRESRLGDAPRHAARLPAILLAAAGAAVLIYGWGFGA